MDTSGLVVDASVAVKWHLEDEVWADRAARLLTRFSHGEVELIAPEHIRYEVPSAITNATLGKTPRLPEHEGKAAIEEFLGLGLTMVGEDAIIVDAYRLSREHGCAFYDALYLAVAERFKLPFVTADTKLYERISKLPYVQWIEEFA
jgi:predicted nucleic acid-binding protein